jgi:glycosyltransferase involved in cell wall biosynthesis
MGLISIIVPVISQVNNLVNKAKQLESLAEVVKDHDFEFIFLDNGSHEASVEALKDRADNDKRYRVVILTRDFGSTALFLAGIAYSSGDCAIYFADNLHDPSEIFIELISHWEAGSRIIFGMRRQKLTGSFRTIPGILKNFTSSQTGFPNRLSLGEINFLLIDNQVMYILSQVSYTQHDIVEILAWTGFQSQLVEYSHQDLSAVEGQYFFQDKLITLKSGIDLSASETYRSSLIIGILLAVFGGLITFGLFAAPNNYQGVIPEWWWLISSMMLVLGTQMSLVGILGEKLHQSLVMIGNKPVFIVDTIINPPAQSTLKGREKLEKMILSLWSIRKQRIDYSSHTISATSDEESPD